jgi:transposase-like protein
MSKSLLEKARFKDPIAARKHLEAIRWPNGPICPHCGAVDRITTLKGKSHRAGLYECGHCRDQFTVTVGTVFERSKIPLHKWLLAATLLNASKKGMSSHQLHRMLGITYKSAWFMTHRLREAMKPKGSGLLGGGGKIVEADETFYGNIKGAKRPPKGGGGAHKHKIFTLIERDGSTRSFHVARVNEKTLKPILMEQVSRDAQLFTDSAGQYRRIKEDFPKHDSVNHLIGEYARGPVHTNTVECFFGLLKRGLVGTYHHVSEAHLQRYCTEFDFRFTHRKISDAERADATLKGISGKRLTYRRTNGAEANA